jgi:hypothetical protein
MKMSSPRRPRKNLKTLKKPFKKQSEGQMDWEPDEEDLERDSEDDAAPDEGGQEEGDMDLDEYNNNPELSDLHESWDELIEAMESNDQSATHIKSVVELKDWAITVYEYFDVCIHPLTSDYDLAGDPRVDFMLRRLTIRIRDVLLDNGYETKELIGKGLDLDIPSKAMVQSTMPILPVIEGEGKPLRGGNCMCKMVYYLMCRFLTLFF